MAILARISSSAAAAFALGAATAAAAPEIGAPAPSFTGETSDGETISLSDFIGQTVVLEWTNDGCPFVQKHYDTQNMQAAQASVTAADGVWISIISSAPGAQGHVSPTEANALTDSRDAVPSHVILDATGDIGRAYGAKTTPHMYVVDEEGALRYAGAIDDQPSANPATVDGATNYALEAFEAVEDGRPVSPETTIPYGCSVKYKS